MNLLYSASHILYTLSAAADTSVKSNSATLTDKGLISPTVIQHKVNVKSVEG